jgi:putative exosortase-associated protein (TIGR04073 family)
MGKKLLIVCLVVCMVAGSAVSCYAASQGLAEGMGKKLVRGVINTLTGWIEIPARIAQGYKDGMCGDKNNKVCGAFSGIFLGIWNGVGRTVFGASDIVGFWAADPKSNDGIGIPLETEYAWESAAPYDLTSPNFGEATIVPMGNKLGRGLGNAFLGFVELPGQIMKGLKLHAPDLGIIKGLWYWYSREVDGISDIVSFMLPNPKDTMALAFDEKWPWSALGDTLKN